MSGNISDAEEKDNYLFAKSIQMNQRTFSDEIKSKQFPSVNICEKVYGVVTIRL